jgi:hypothetical protein
VGCCEKEGTGSGEGYINASRVNNNRPLDLVDLDISIKEEKKIHLLVVPLAQRGNRELSRASTAIVVT